MFHLGWFLGAGFGIQPWNRLGRGGTWNGNNGTSWMRSDLYVDLARSLERGGFDYILIEDTAMIDDTYGGSMEGSLKYGLFAPKNDPLPLVPLMTQATDRIGIVTTMSTLQYPPYLAARLMTTLDHLTEGRAGINVVTSVSHRVAQNFGYEKMLAHDVRYAMAREWMDVATQLWESWEPGAVVLDDEGFVYADHTKVHTIDFKGEYYSCRGPLNTVPGPQGRPVVCQAGNSTPGRELAAATADTMLAIAENVEQMRAFREDMHARLERHGRKPSELKILFVVTPIIGETDEDAQDRLRAQAEAASSQDAINMQRWVMSYQSGGEVDFSTLDLDEPFPETLVGNGEHSSISAWVRASHGRSLRELIVNHRNNPNLGLVGSCDTVAALMGEMMEEVGGDGFLISPPLNRRTIVEFSDGLCTALQRRGLIRDGFGGETFRENLLEF